MREAFVPMEGVEMKPSIVIYCCANATAHPEEDVENSAGKADIKLSLLPCSGRTDVLHMVRAIEAGADMVLVAGCPEENCRYLQGSLKAGQRVGYANKLLSEIGLGRERVKRVVLDPDKDGAFASALEEVIARAAELGPWLHR